MLELLIGFPSVKTFLMTQPVRLIRDEIEGEVVTVFLWFNPQNSAEGQVCPAKFYFFLSVKNSDVDEVLCGTVASQPEYVTLKFQSCPSNDTESPVAPERSRSNL